MWILNIYKRELLRLSVKSLTLFCSDLIRSQANVHKGRRRFPSRINYWEQYCQWLLFLPSQNGQSGYFLEIYVRAFWEVVGSIRDGGWCGRGDLLPDPPRFRYGSARLPGKTEFSQWASIWNGQTYIVREARPRQNSLAEWRDLNFLERLDLVRVLKKVVGFHGRTLPS